MKPPSGRRVLLELAFCFAWTGFSYWEPDQHATLVVMLFGLNAGITLGRYTALRNR